MNENPKDVSISVISATYNATSVLPDLINSLLNQTDQQFEWVVVDGASTDKTVELVQSCKLANVNLLSERDCGIYMVLITPLFETQYK